MSSVKWQWLWRIFFHVGNHSFLIQCERFFKPPRPSFLIKSFYKTGLEFTEYLKRFVAVKWKCKSPRPTQRPPKWLNYDLFLGHCGGHEEWRKNKKKHSDHDIKEVAWCPHKAKSHRILLQQTSFLTYSKSNNKIINITRCFLGFQKRMI